jgi:dolichyl-phosphate beta-glucosyltransferase
MTIKAAAEISFSLIVPAYNEERRLGMAIPNIFEYLKSTFDTFEILYVDDGSQDLTYARLEEASANYPELKVLRHDRNYGKGFAIRTGLKAARGRFILFSDADFSTPIEEIDGFLRKLEEGFDIVIGSRAIAGSNVEIHQSALREITGKIGNAIVQALLLLPFQDTQCGFKMFRRESVQSILPFLTIDGFAFDIEMLVVATAQGMRITEVPVTWRNVLDSKVKMIHTLQVLADVLRIRYQLALGKYS